MTFLKFKAASKTKNCSLKLEDYKPDHLGCVFSPRNAQRSGPAWREVLGFAGQGEGAVFVVDGMIMWTDYGLSARLWGLRRDPTHAAGRCG